MSLQVRANHRLGWLLVAVLIALFSLWMKAAFPVAVIGGAAHDDGFFQTAARTMGAGHWLGIYNKMTLIKGQFYSLFLLTAFLLHIPLKMAEQGVYIAVSGGVAMLVARLAGRRMGMAIFAILCLNPVPWWPELARVIREGLYVSLSLGVVLLSVVCSFPEAKRPRRGAVFWGVGLGLTGGAFWITREEGLWLAPTVFCIFLLGLAHEAFFRTGPGHRLRFPRQMFVSWVPAAVAHLLVVGVVCGLNYYAYGVFVTTEFKQASFQHAYGALARIKHEHWQRYVVFPADARQKAYAVSPAARELAPVLDGPVGQAWAQPQCDRFHIEPCSGVHAGWFMWALRDAVSEAGHYATAREADAFYERLAEEIDSACDADKIPCLPPRSTLVSPFRPIYVSDTLHEMVRMFALMLNMGSDEVGPHPSTGTPFDLASTADLVGPIMPADTHDVIASGWVIGTDVAPSVKIDSRRTGTFSSYVATGPGADVEAQYPGRKAVRFTIDTGCAIDDCDMVLSRPGQADVVVPFSRLKEEEIFPDATLKVHLDELTERNPYKASMFERSVQIHIGRAIQWAYAAAANLLWPVACAGTLLGSVLFRSSRCGIALYALTLASASAVATRVVLLSYLEVTSIPSENMLYLSPATPFLLLFTALGLLVGARAVIGLLRSRRPLAQDSLPRELGA